jgi:serine/threonine-protein kinase
LDERIATGGMGDVWRGTDVVLGRTVAVKVLRPAMLADPEFAARFYGEARMMAAFRHPGVVEVYDYASADDSADGEDCAYLVMAYVDGEPLSTRLKEVGRLTVAETMSIVAQTADALHAAHENGTIHRDVKPGNLIVKPSGAVILVDFGVARSNAVTSLTGLNAIVGTALYMAPEQVAKGRVTPATDIYALGAVAYHCVAGRPPFDGDNALQVALRHLEEEPDPLPDDVPPPVRALIGQAMAKRPADRFATAADLGEAARAATGSMDRQALTAAAATVPLSPAPLGQGPPGSATRTRTAALPGGLPPPAPPGRTGKPRGQLVVLVTVVGLLLAAAGLALAIALSGNTTTDPSGTPTGQPSASTGATSEDQAPPPPSARSNHTTKPNGNTARPSSNPPRTSATPSAPATTRPATTPATTTAPTTAPTTGAATTQPTPTGTALTTAAGGPGQ